MMATSDGDDCQPHPADLFYSRRELLLEDFQSRLLDSGNSLVIDSASREQLCAQAENVIADVCRSLRAGDVLFDNNTLPLTHDIAVSRVEQRVHPVESLRAAQVLFDATIDAAVAALDQQANGARLLATVAGSAHHSIMTRVGEASTDYTGLMLKEIHQAHLGERYRIARELHDRVGSNVSAATVNLELYEAYAGNETVRAANKILIAKDALRGAVDSIREVTAELRQPPIESLSKALRRYVESLPESDTDVHLVANGDQGLVPPEIMDELFLITREAMRNALTHAHAKNLVARVDIAPHGARVVVADDGTGIDDNRRDNGAGLASMSERSALLGGTCTITSAPGRGTRVEAFIPLPGVRDEHRC